MHPVTIVLLVILVILIGLLVGLYFFGKKTQKKQEEQQAQIEASKQTVSMLVIDKKRMPLKESGLPQMVIDQTPKLLRRSKLPIVKAKVGPKISILIADEKVFDLIPVKKEIKAEVSGLYIVGVKVSAVTWTLRLRRKKDFSHALRNLRKKLRQPRMRLRNPKRIKRNDYFSPAIMMAGLFKCSFPHIVMPVIISYVLYFIRNLSLISKRILHFCKILILNLISHYPYKIF